MLHDFDYEMHPRAPHHPMKGAEILAARGLDRDVVYAILAHADYSGMPRVSRLDRALYACDELTGFVHACALVRPGKVITGLEPASVRKKLKDKGFARTVNRDDVYRGRRGARRRSRRPHRLRCRGFDHRRPRDRTSPGADGSARRAAGLASGPAGPARMVGSMADMRRRSLPLFVATILILGTGALVEGQQPSGQPLNAQALRAREAECEARLQAVYRQRSEGVGKVYASAEAKAAEWQQLETALQAERTCLTETDDALVKALTAQEAECQKLAGRRSPGATTTPATPRAAPPRFAASAPRDSR